MSPLCAAQITIWQVNSPWFGIPRGCGHLVDPGEDIWVVTEGIRHGRGILVLDVANLHLNETHIDGT